MSAKSQQLEGRDGTLSSLNVAIDAMNLAKEVSCITPAKAAFGSVSIILTMIRVRALFYGQMPQAHSWTGLDGQQTGLR